MTDGAHNSENRYKKDEVKALQLEALKAIRESAFGRWEKRRSYEWQLSISIWTALAAFSGIVLTRDLPFQGEQRFVPWIVAAVGVAIAGIQFYYLLKMMDGTLGDAEIQRWAEKRIYKLAFEKSITDEDEFKAKEEASKSRHPFYKPLSRYGFVQVGITLLLVAGAVSALLMPRQSSLAPSKPSISAH